MQDSTSLPGAKLHLASLPQSEKIVDLFSSNSTTELDDNIANPTIKRLDRYRYPPPQLPSGDFAVGQTTDIKQKPQYAMAATSETPNMDQQVDLSTIPISPNGKSESTEAKDGDKPVTVFHDKDNFNVKHPLQNKWTLWFTKPPSGKVWTPVH